MTAAKAGISHRNGNHLKETIMSNSIAFKSVGAINNSMDTKAPTVKALDPAVGYWTKVLGFALVKRDPRSAIVRRDDVQIELVAKEDDDPGKAGSCYFDVSDVEALHREFTQSGAKPGALEVREHDGGHYKLFFAVEPYDGYCFCFGQPWKSSQL